MYFISIGNNLESFITDYNGQTYFRTRGGMTIPWLVLSGCWLLLWNWLLNPSGIYLSGWLSMHQDIWTKTTCECFWCSRLPVVCVELAKRLWNCEVWSKQTTETGCLQSKSWAFWNVLGFSIKVSCLCQTFSSFTTSQWLVSKCLLTSQHLP